MTAFQRDWGDQSKLSQGTAQGDEERWGGPISHQCPLLIPATVQACSWGGWARERVCGGAASFSDPLFLAWPSVAGP